MKKFTLVSPANKFFSLILLIAISISIFSYVFAATPNPGHDFTSTSGGVVQGNILYGSAADTLSALAKDTNATRYLSNTGASNNPAWAQVVLTNGVSGILPGANGGTNNGFLDFTGPASTLKTFTLPNASAAILTDNADVTVAQGGTGLSTLTTNNLLVGAGTGNVTFIAPSTSGNVLTSNGTTWSSAAPSVRSVFNQSVADQGAGFASDTYVTGSSVTIPATGLRVGTRYHMIFAATKTAAGTATPILNVRFGINGSTADTSRCTITFSAQTAATDTGTFEVWATFRTIGSGTSAVLQCVGQRRHGASVTGFGNLVSQTLEVTSGGFDSTVGSSIIGVSANGGASASWTIQLVQAELENLP
jgi:hypothetical protein